MISYEYLLHGLVALLRATACGSAPVLSQTATSPLDADRPAATRGSPRKIENEAVRPHWQSASTGSSA